MKSFGVPERADQDVIARKPWIDVCICTYRRPQLLARALGTVLSQDTRDLFDFGIIVIDNDANASAETTVRTLVTSNRRFVYDIEREQNISLARNRALGHAAGDFVAIIDDDEQACPLWLYHLYRTMLAYDADAVFGPVFRYFEHDPPAHVEQSGAFVCPDPPTGSQEGYVCGGNALIRRSLLLDRATPFDPSFGRTGGGDSNLYIDLKRNGHKLVWCSEARVRELVPPERTRWSWILKRDFRVGNNTDRFHHRPYPSMRGLARGFLEPLGKTCISLLPLSSTEGRVPTIQHLRRCAWALGRIAHRFGIHYEEYADRSRGVDGKIEPSNTQRTIQSSAEDMDNTSDT